MWTDQTADPLNANLKGLLQNDQHVQEQQHQKPQAHITASNVLVWKLSYVYKMINVKKKKKEGNPQLFTYFYYYF